MKIALIFMAIILMNLCYEIGYCKGFEQRGEIESEKFVKGESDEKKDL